MGAQKKSPPGGHSNGQITKIFSSPLWTGLEEKSMFEKEIRELFELSMRVMQETDAFVDFQISSYSSICEMRLNRTKDLYGVKGYIIYMSEIMKEISMENYAAAKEHLLALLEGKKNPEQKEEEHGE